MVQNQGLDRRYHLKEREVREILERAAVTLGKIDLTPFMKGMETAKISPQDEVLIMDDTAIFIRANGEVFPTLLNKEVLQKLPVITVDMGAVPHLCNGADLMAQGIVNASGEFQTGAMVVIVDEKFFKPIALVKILYSSNELLEKKQGKVADNIHFVGDRFWKLYKQAKSRT
ncbi:MAG: PUA domain-containing protein [Candidatus Bathyarchaeota archaeon]